jgi:hypothetical protein
MVQQSEAAFRKQFDPNSATFHGGSNVPVPLKGERIPDSMTTMYPEGFDPTKTADNIDYGEAYNQIES